MSTQALTHEADCATSDYQSDSGHPLSVGVYSHPVMVTEAPAGVPATVLGRLATPDLSTATYVPSPTLRQKAGVASDALEALGKLGDVKGKSRHSTTDVELVGLWLNAHRTRHLVPVACQRTPASDLLALVNMAQSTPTNLLFACDNSFADDLLSALQAVAPVQVPWPDLPENHPEPETPDRANRWPAEQVLPAVEYWTFYATARRQLSPTDFAPVHDLYCDTLDRISSWMRDLAAANTDLTVRLAHESLKVLIEEQTTFDRITVVIRAAQAAYHRNGWFLDVDERELRNGLIRFPSTRTTPDLYDRLRAYREPTRSGTVALYLAGATPQAIRDTTVDDLAQWHHDPRHLVADVTVPNEAAPYLRATLFAHGNDASALKSAAFPGDTRRVNLDIRQAATDLDLNIGDANLHQTSTLGSRRVPINAVKLEHIA